MSIELYVNLFVCYMGANPVFNIIRHVADN